MLNMLFLFDVLGTFAFSVYGAYLAQRKGFDIFGVFVCAGVSALAGGTLRELFLNRLPVYFSQPVYMIAILIGMVFSIAVYKQFGSLQKIMLSIDALGLVTFAYLGAVSAQAAGLGLVGTLVFAVVSAVGGGVCCDVLVRETPRIFYQDFYATPAFLVGLGVYLFHAWLSDQRLVYLLLFVIFGLRLAGIKFRFQLWKPVEVTEKSAR